MVRIIAAVAALSLMLSGCNLADCSTVGHRVECSRTDAGAVECVDAGWQDAGWWHEANPGVVCVDDLQPAP